MTSRRESRESDRTSTPTASELMTRLVRYWRFESKDWSSGSDRHASWYDDRSGLRCSFEINGLLDDEDGVV